MTILPFVHHHPQIQPLSFSRICSFPYSFSLRPPPSLFGGPGLPCLSPHTGQASKLKISRAVHLSPNETRLPCGVDHVRQTTRIEFYGHFVCGGERWSVCWGGADSGPDAVVFCYRQTRVLVTSPHLPLCSCVSSPSHLTRCLPTQYTTAFFFLSNLCNIFYITRMFSYTIQ